MLLLTVAICTFNRQFFLEKCLSELLPQISNNKNVRVLVINNNSTDNTVKVVQTFQSKYTCLDYVFCPQQGLSHARNCALEQSHSLWLSFLDDDGYPEKNWLEQNLRIIEENKYDAFGGVYLPWFKDGKKQWFKASYETNEFRMPQANEVRLAPGDSYFSGGNCSFKVKAIHASGGFPLTLGMNGNAMGYGEEVAAQRSMAIKGYVLGFSRQLVLHHYVPATKQSVRWAWKRAYSKGRDFWFIYSKPVTLSNLWFFLKRRLLNSLVVSVRTTSMLFSRDKSFTLKNACYEMSVWAGLVGAILGAVQAKFTSK